MKRLVLVFLLIATSAWGQTATWIQDRTTSGYKANVKKVGSDYGLQTISLDKALQVRIDYDSGSVCSTCIVYVGFSDPAALASEAKWKIIKLLYTGTNITQVQLANQVNTFSLIWDSRGSYDYVP